MQVAQVAEGPLDKQVAEAFAKGTEEGFAEGFAEGKEEGVVEQRQQVRRQMAPHYNACAYRNCGTATQCLCIWQLRPFLLPVPDMCSPVSWLSCSSRVSLDLFCLLAHCKSGLSVDGALPLPVVAG